jgi:hypothetical protein
LVLYHTGEYVLVYALSSGHDKIATAGVASCRAFIELTYLGVYALLGEFVTIGSANAMWQNRHMANAIAEIFARVFIWFVLVELICVWRKKHRRLGFLLIVASDLRPFCGGFIGGVLIVCYRLLP